VHPLDQVSPVANGNAVVEDMRRDNVSGEILVLCQSSTPRVLSVHLQAAKPGCSSTLLCSPPN
jgi:hypothetical protein